MTGISEEDAGDQKPADHKEEINAVISTADMNSEVAPKMLNEYKRDGAKTEAVQAGTIGNGAVAQAARWASCNCCDGLYRIDVDKKQ